MTNHLKGSEYGTISSQMNTMQKQNSEKHLSPLCDFEFQSHTFHWQLLHYPYSSVSAAASF